MTRLVVSACLFGLGLLVFQLARAGLVLGHWSQFSDLPGLRIAAAWAGGLRFDASILAIVLALPLLLINLPFRFALKPAWMRFWGWSAFGFLAALILVLAGDGVYFGHVHRHLASELLQLGGDRGFLLRVALGPALPLLLAVLAFIAGLGLLWRRFLGPPRPEARPAWRFALVVLLLFAAIRGSFGLKPLSPIDAFAGVTDPREAHLALNGAFSGFHAMAARRPVRSRFFDDTEALRILGLPEAPYPFERAGSGRGPGRNVILVLLESWSACFVDSFGGEGVGMTPRFDALAAEGIRFTRFYSAGQRSYEGVQAALTGLPALPRLPTLTDGLQTAVTRLGALAGAAGYRTLFLQSSSRPSLRGEAIAGTAGFGEYYGAEDMPLILDYPSPKAAAYGWDYEMYRFLLDRLEGETRPFCVLAFTGTTHIPYPPLPPRFTKLPPDRGGDNAFLNALGYADHSIGEFIEGARTQPWFGNTIFVFTADHPRGGTDLRLFERLFHVPLLVYAPGIVEPGTVETVGSQLDLLPTLVELMGLAGPYSALGEPLLSKEPGAAAAFVTAGPLVGLIGSHGYVAHSLAERVDSRVAPDAPPGYLDGLERRLLATCQAVYTMHERNRWARP